MKRLLLVCLFGIAYVSNVCAQTFDTYKAYKNDIRKAVLKTSITELGINYEETWFTDCKNISGQESLQKMCTDIFDAHKKEDVNKIAKNDKQSVLKGMEDFNQKVIGIVNNVKLLKKDGKPINKNNIINAIQKTYQSYTKKDSNTKIIMESKTTPLITSNDKYNNKIELVLKKCKDTCDCIKKLRSARKDVLATDSIYDELFDLKMKDIAQRNKKDSSVLICYIDSYKIKPSDSIKCEWAHSSLIEIRSGKHEGKDTLSLWGKINHKNIDSVKQFIITYNKYKPARLVLMDIYTSFFEKAKKEEDKKGLSDTATVAAYTYFLTQSEDFDKYIETTESQNEIKKLREEAKNKTSPDYTKYILLLIAGVILGGIVWKRKGLISFIGKFSKNTNSTDNMNELEKKFEIEWESIKSIEHTETRREKIIFFRGKINQHLNNSVKLQEINKEAESLLGDKGTESYTNTENIVTETIIIPPVKGDNVNHHIVEEDNKKKDTIIPPNYTVKFAAFPQSNVFDKFSVTEELDNFSLFRIHIYSESKIEYHIIDQQEIRQRFMKSKDNLDRVFDFDNHWLNKTDIEQLNPGILKQDGRKYIIVQKIKIKFI